VKSLQTRDWLLALWVLEALSFLVARARRWGPQPTTTGELLLHLAASGGETVIVFLLLRPQRSPLAGNLAAAALVCLLTLLWSARATPSGSGAGVAHVIWLMLVLVLLSGRLGWAIVKRILCRPREP